MRRAWFVIYNLLWGLGHSIKYRHDMYNKQGVGSFRICEPRIRLLGYRSIFFTPDLPDNVTYTVSATTMDKIAAEARTSVEAVRIISDAIGAEKEVS